jgi:hypothetical protein
MTVRLSRQRKNRPEKSGGSRSHQSRVPQGIGPRLGFLGALVLVLLISAIANAALQPELVMPMVVGAFLTLAGTFGLMGWRSLQSRDAHEVTCGDVAGALTLIGFFAAATIDSDQMLRLMQSK